MSKENLVEVKNLKKWFPVRRNFNDVLKGEHKFVKAVDGVSFTIKKGEVLGLIGESGCGKSTTARLVMKLHEATEGQIIFEGEDVTETDKKRTEEYRKEVQMIFQDPYASMNPRFKVKKVLEEALLIHKTEPSRKKRLEKIKKALMEVKLTPVEEFLDRYPHMLSGGQRQRAATARALMLSPKLLVADEPVSMIDLSTKAEILQMFKEIQKDLNLTYLYITHDLSTARYFTDRIAVMYLGRIVEIGTPDNVIDNPKHPYTKALIQAVCDAQSGKVNQVKEVDIEGEIPSASNIPQGCRFHTRCIYATDACKQETQPELEKVSTDHEVSCFRWKEL